MVKVVFVNHTKQACGVYQFGAIIAEALRRSDKIDLLYLETDDGRVLETLEWAKYDAFIYNYHNQTMRWLDSDNTEFLHRHGVKQFCLTGHDHVAEFERTYNIIADPTGVDDEKTFYTGRILPEAEIVPVKNKVVTIGSFGFGFHQKNFNRFVSLINAEFDEATIRLHVSRNDFADIDGYMASMFLGQAGAAVKPGITFEASTDFKSRPQMVQWLSENDLNLFVYDDQPGRGISSAIDFALAAKKPIGISKSCMFRHIWDDPRIIVESTSLKDIIANGTEPLEKYYKAWSLENATKRYEEIFQTCISQTQNS